MALTSGWVEAGPDSGMSTTVDGAGPDDCMATAGGGAHGGTADDRVDATGSGAAGDGIVAEGSLID